MRSRALKREEDIYEEVNLYAFVKNDGINFLDELGLRGTPTVPGRPVPPPTRPPSPGGLGGAIGGTIEAIMDAIAFGGSLSEARAAAIIGMIAKAAPSICDDDYRNHRNPAPEGCGCCVYMVTVTRKFPASSGGWLMPPSPASGPAVAVHGFWHTYVPISCDETDRGGHPGQIMPQGRSEIFVKRAK